MMVSPDEKRQDWPSHSLARVQELAREGKVNFTRSVQRDTKSLEYPPDEVFECLAKLHADDFEESILYPDSPQWLDVYVTKWCRDSGTVDPLYIKFALSRSCLIVVLFSFHRPR